MTISAHDAYTFLHSVAGQPGSGPWPSGARTAEYLRSPAAVRIARLAADQGLFAFHFEHRHRLELPEVWCGEDASDLPDWSGGVLPESKYQSFQHEHAVASFHPSHRAKWGTHELCHALVGFAWKPDATPLFHATAGRVAELLPVALWYFFDEAFSRRCPLHEGQGALYRDSCVACEAAAACNPDAPDALAHLEAGIRYVEDELAAVERTIRTGRPIPHRLGPLNLCTDGLAYARSHGARLQSRAFAVWVDRFAVAGGGWWTDLDSLIARVREVCRAVLLGEPLAALAPSAEAGRDRWIRQDLGARLLQVWEDTEGECAEGLMDIVESLASGAPVVSVAESYCALEAEWVLPSPQQVFATGYPVAPGLGSDLEQLTRGVRSALPATCDALGDELGECIENWARSESWTREGIGRRFASWLAEHHPGRVADTARYEAALTHPPECEVALSRLLGVGEPPERLTTGVEVLTLSCHPDPDGPPGPACFLVARDGGEALVVAVEPDDGTALERGGLPNAAVLPTLRELGLVTGTRWRV